MNTEGKINDLLKELPRELHVEVLDFVQFLSRKRHSDDRQWSRLSVESALRGMEEEGGPEYNDGDLVERWQ